MVKKEDWQQGMQTLEKLLQLKTQDPSASNFFREKYEFEWPGSKDSKS